MVKIKNIIPIFLVLFLLISTRFINLTWGFPYLFHPDERNIVISLGQLTCGNILNLQECLNPNFFAYGQFFIYLGKFFSFWSHSLSFLDLTLILRVLSAGFSILTVWIGVLIVNEITKIYIDKYSKKTILITSSLLFIFSPSLIQIAHFGTTESVLSFLFTYQIYSSILFLNNKKRSVKYLTESSLIIGIAVATKVSSLIFLSLPLIALALNKKILIKKKLIYLLHISFFSLVTTFIFSPHYLISYREFLSSLNYESAVALGKIMVFYTRQFEGTIPVIFQFTQIFPYSLGLPVFISFIIGFLYLPKNNINNFLKYAFLVYFISTSFLFAKWTRFMAPIIPLMIVISYLFLLDLFSKKIKDAGFRRIILCMAILLLIIPGFKFISIYTGVDSRIKASEWIVENIPSGSVILSETANVVDIPVGNYKGKNYEIISSNLYNIDNHEMLYKTFQNDLKRADYILIPSRRVFASHLKKTYPKINKYYSELFSGKLGFKKVSEFKYLDDEQAEETFSVFDHPVVRIYKRI